MADLVYVAVVIVFFTVAALYVVACDRVIGPDPEDLDPEDLEDQASDPVVQKAADAAGAVAR